MKFRGGLSQAPSSQTVGSLFRTPWPALLARRMIVLEMHLLVNQRCKFYDSLTILFGNYCIIVWHGESHFGCQEQTP